VTCEGSYAAQIDPATNTQVGEVDLGSNSFNPVLIGDRTWVAPDGPRIVRLDPVSHDIDRAVVPGTGFARGGDALVAAGSLWVMDWAANRVLRLPLAAFGG
jgi:streptogramin lyase